MYMQNGIMPEAQIFELIKPERLKLTETERRNIQEKMNENKDLDDDDNFTIIRRLFKNPTEGVSE